MLDPRKATGAFGRVVSALNAFNQRHPWSHNDHFHGWILRHLPQSRGTALEVGCGRGDLADRLSAKVDRVHAIDLDPEMARVTTARFETVDRVDVRQESFLQASGEYDLITMVAVLHHLDHEEALTHARQLLRPKGKLLVVGLARMSSAADLAWDVSSSLLNPVVGMIKHPRVSRNQASASFPVADATLSFAEIKQLADRVLPGSRIRRRLFFRYTLEWTKPIP